jgi:hypothetical protein
VVDNPVTLRVPVCYQPKQQHQGNNRLPVTLESFFPLFADVHLIANVLVNVVKRRCCVGGNVLVIRVSINKNLQHWTSSALAPRVV